MLHRSVPRACLFIILALTLGTLESAQVAEAAAGVVDTDGDGVPDSQDNCQTVSNPDQRDTNADGFGNACDPDLNNDGIVNFADLAMMRSKFFSGDGDADLNGDGVVNFADLARLKSFFFKPPGPSCCVTPPPFEGVVCNGPLPTSECVITVRGIKFLTTRDKISAIAGIGAGAAAAGLPPVGIYVADDLRIVTPFGDIVLGEASLSVMIGAGGAFESLVGTARVPFPAIGFMSGIHVDQTPMATIGIDFGANINVGVPLQPAVSYLFFQFSSSFGASLGPVSFKAGGPDATLVLNPADPFVFVGGSIGNLIPGAGEPPPASGTPSAAGAPIFVEPDFGFGISLGAKIPFFTGAHDARVVGAPLDPTCNQCVTDICAADPVCCASMWDSQCVSKVQTICGGSDPSTFLGHLLLKGPIPLGELPLSLKGITIANIDPDKNGTIFVGSPDLQLGAKGALGVSVPFLTFFALGFDLGTADAVVGYAAGAASACFIGTLDPADPFAMFPANFPIPIKQSPQKVGASVAGSFNTAAPQDSFVRASGEFSIDLKPIGAPIGVNLGELAASSVKLRIDRSGLLFQGMTSSQIIPNLTNAEMSLAVHIPVQNALQSSAELKGALTVAGVGLDPARIFISPLGFKVEGNLDLAPIAALTVVGGIDQSGVMLTGNFNSNIHFDLQKTVDDTLFEANLAVSLAQDALNQALALASRCKGVCGDCYLNPCCVACDATFGAPILAAQAALGLAKLALDGVQQAANLFFAALPFPLSGTVVTHVDVTIDNIDIHGAVSASLSGINLGGSARFFPPQVCVTLPLGSFPGASTLGLGNTNFCLPPS